MWDQHLPIFWIIGSVGVRMLTPNTYRAWLEVASAAVGKFGWTSPSSSMSIVSIVSIVPIVPIWLTSDAQNPKTIKLIHYVYLSDQ